MDSGNDWLPDAGRRNRNRAERRWIRCLSEVTCGVDHLDRAAAWKRSVVHRRLGGRLTDPVGRRTEVSGFADPVGR